MLAQSQQQQQLAHTTRSVGAVLWDMGSRNVVENPEGEELWIMAIRSLSTYTMKYNIESVGLPPGWILFLVDSGADEHCCPYDFGLEFGEIPYKGSLNAISGEGLGAKPVMRVIEFETENQKYACAGMVPSNVTRPVLSSGKLNRSGYGVWQPPFDSRAIPTRAPYVQHPSGDKIPMYLKVNTWYIIVRLREPTNQGRLYMAPISAEQPAV